MSTIVINNLRAFYPNSRIDFLTEKPGSGIVLGNPKLDHVHILKKDRNQSGLTKNLADIKFIRHIQKQNYDLVFDYFGNPRSALLTWMSGARHRVGYDYRVRKLAYNHIITSRASEIHEALWHLDALAWLGIPIVDTGLDFYIDPQSKEFANDYWQETGLGTRPVFAINFSGGWPAKRWPIEQFAKLIDQIKVVYDVDFLVLWGPGEKQDALRLVELTKTRTYLIPQTDLKQLGALLSKVSMMVTTDSGPMHIAAAMQVPCVAIYGPTNFKLQGPYGDFHEIVYKDDLDCLGCNRLDCDHSSCMNALTVERVFQGVENCINKNRVL